MIWRFFTDSIILMEQTGPIFKRSFAIPFRAILLLGLALVALIAVYFLRSQPQWRPVETDPAPTEILVETELIVHIAGEVINPGVYKLLSGSRVIDVVTAAGGVTESAELSGINLARVIKDGEQLLVPVIGAVSANTGTGPGLINLNTASASELDTLPRIGPSLANRIIKWREEYGPFSDLNALSAVSGIGPSVLNELDGKVSF